MIDKAVKIFFSYMLFYPINDGFFYNMKNIALEKKEL
jgi:hypothetical protein